MKNPLISVIMPVHNGEKFLSEAIGSILNQKISDFEFIIIDDNSNDSSVDILQKYVEMDTRICVLYNSKKLGISKSLNRGISRATGKYIARMDSDDISLCNRFELQIGFLELNEDVYVCGSNIAFIDDQNNSLSLFNNFVTGMDDILMNMPFTNVFRHPTLVFKRKIFDEFTYDSNFDGAEDYLLMTKICQKYKCFNLSEILLEYRISENQVTSKLSRNRDVLNFKIQLKYIHKIKYLHKYKIILKYYIFIFKRFYVLISRWRLAFFIR